MRTVSALWLLAPALVGTGAIAPRVREHGAAVMARFVEGTPLRAVVACRGERPVHLEIEGASSAFGARPFGSRAVVALARRDGQASCVLDDAPTGQRETISLRPLVLSAVTPSVVRDDKGPRLVVAIDGKALSPKSASEDGIYLVAAGRLLHMGEACPEARYTSERVVGCLPLAEVEGVVRAHVRLQSAGRLAQAPGGPIELDRTMAR